MEGTVTSSSSTVITPRKSDDKLRGLFPYCGRLTLKFRCLKVQRSDGKHYKNLTISGNFDCKSLASVAIATKQPRPVGEFWYDPLSYSQNLDEGSWHVDDGGYAGRGFSSRFAFLPLSVNSSTTTTTSSDWN